LRREVPVHDASEQPDPSQSLAAFVRGEAGWSALQDAGLHGIDRGSEGILMEEAPGLPVPRPTAPELAQGLLAYAPFPVELRDWARVVVCVADLGDASHHPEGGRLVATIWGATEGVVPDEDMLVVLRRIARSEAHG
jgi:hypothetical protein